MSINKNLKSFIIIYNTNKLVLGGLLPKKYLIYLSKPKIEMLVDCKREISLISLSFIKGVRFPF